MNIATGVMIALVSFLGACVLAFSHRYLRGERAAFRYYLLLLGTLAAVMVLVASDDLRVLIGGWVSASLFLHGLLLLYPDRRGARLAAHKKFVLSRVADMMAIVAVSLLGAALGTYRLSELNIALSQHGELPLAVHAAAILFVVVAWLKSAQLPFHGWLMQVMEAPTPVSALLHAGVVNIAGYVLIRLAPVLERAPAAQALLVAVGGATALLGALVMTTKASVKAALAWSTAAQLGFMLVQCGLGLYGLALLHLLAHSAYKAHAFLSAANVGAELRATRDVDRPPPQRVRFAAVALASWAALAALVSFRPDMAALALCWGVALPFVLHARAGFLPKALFVVCGVAWHTLATWALPSGPPSVVPLIIALAYAVLLVVVQTALLLAPTHPVLVRLRPRVAAGFYLDEYFTSFTFKLWPPRRAPALLDLSAEGTKP